MSESSEVNSAGSLESISLSVSEANHELRSDLLSLLSFILILLRSLLALLNLYLSCLLIYLLSLRYDLLIFLSFHFG